MSAQTGKRAVIGRRGIWGLAAMLAVHAGLLAYLAAPHSPTIHEMGHLPAGLCHWQYGMFELYRVNPPLPRMMAALPVLFLPATNRLGQLPTRSALARNHSDGHSLRQGQRRAHAVFVRGRTLGLHPVLSGGRLGVLSLG